MGTDYKLNIVYGVKFVDLCEKFNERTVVKYTKYNPDNGEPYTVENIQFVTTLLNGINFVNEYDFMDFFEKNGLSLVGVQQLSSAVVGIVISKSCSVRAGNNLSLEIKQANFDICDKVRKLLSELKFDICKLNFDLFAVLNVSS